MGIRTYKRKNFTLNINQEHKTQILNKRILQELRNSKFKPLPNTTNVFSELKSTDVFVKKISKHSFDKRQLKDYIEQKKVISNIPDIYGTVEFKKNIYVFSKLIKDKIDVVNNINKFSKKDISFLRSEIIRIGTKLIEKNLLPSEFALRQFFFSKDRKKVYFVDNIVGVFNAKQLELLLKQTNLDIPRKLKILSHAYSLLSARGMSSVVKSMKGRKEESIFTVFPSLQKYKHDLIDLQNRFTRKTTALVNKYYDSLSLDKKKIIQKQILKNCLNELDTLTNK